MKVAFKTAYFDGSRFYCTHCGYQLKWSLIYLFDKPTVVLCICGKIYEIVVRVEANEKK